MKRRAIAGAILASALGASAFASTVDLRKTTIKATDGSEVPVKIARPAGKGPFPPVLFIHAKRGYEGDERAHVRELAEQGFLVVAPDWQSGRFIERWPSAHNPDTELDVEAGLDYLKSLPNACRQPVGIVGLSRGPYYAIRLAAKRGADIAAIVSYYGHMQNPNAPEPDQLFRVAPEHIDSNPMAWYIMVNGYIVDARTAPREIQEEAYQRGMIPYLPADHSAAERSALPDDRPRCGLCGSSDKPLRRTECCRQWICDDEDQYVMFSFARNSCARNHDRYTLCSFHYHEGHAGNWQDCEQCRTSFDAEMYVYYGTNEYNFEKRPDPPTFEPTHCASCGRIISLGHDGYLQSGTDYYCQNCANKRKNANRYPTYYIPRVQTSREA